MSNSKTIIKTLSSLGLVCILILVLSETSIGLVSPGLDQDLQTALDSEIITNDVMGASVAIIIPDQGTWIGVSGMSDPITQGIMQPGMLFGVGSITKTFVATLIFKLAEEGWLSLEDTLDEYLPSHPNIEDTITIRQLLSHTSGIYDFTEHPGFFDAVFSDPLRFWSPEDTIITFVNAPSFPPGSSREYSNTNYILLGMIIKEATNSDVSMELRNRFWDTLNLNNTFLGEEDIIPNNFDFAHNWFDLDADGVLDDMYSIPRTSLYSMAWTAGAIISTANDLARWAHSLYGGEILSQASLDQMLTFTNTIGLGAEEFNFFNKVLWGQQGNIAGYYGLMMYMPENGVSIAVLVNQDDENDGNVESIAAALLNVILNYQPPADNHAPVASDDAYSVEEESTLTVDAPGVLVNDSDVDGDALTATLVGGVAHGTLTLNADGSFTYEPEANFTGTDSFSYTAHDGTSASNEASVSIAVTESNDPPVADDQSVATSEDTAAGITLTASDEDEDPLTYSVVTGTGNGSITGTAPYLTYTPEPDFSGSDSFTFKANDGLVESNVATVSITIMEVNDAPVSNDQSVTVEQNGAVPVMLSASDVDGDPLVYSVVTPPANGTLSGTAPDLTYTPDPDYTGSDSFTYTASDSVLDSNLAFVTITVLPSWGDPVVAWTATDQNPGGNWSNSGWDNRSFRILLDGAFITTSGSNVQLTLRGRSSGDYTVQRVSLVQRDGNTLNGVDSTNRLVTFGGSWDAGVTVPANGTVTSDPIPFDLVAGQDMFLTFWAPSGNPTVYRTGGANTSAWALAGTDQSTTIDWQGLSISDTLAYVYIIEQLDVIGTVNDDPVANDDTAATDEDTPVTIDVLDGDTDADGDSLFIDSVTDGSNGTVNNNVTDVTYTPDADWNGTDNFSYTVSDGNGGTDTATVTVTVNPVNDPPVADDVSDTTDEDTPIAITLTASDVDGDTLTYSIVTNPTHGTLSGTAPDLTYTPDADYNGSDNFAFKANDGSDDSNTATVNITVNTVNDASVADDQDVITPEDTPVAITLTGNDADGDPLSFTIVTTPTNGNLSGTAPNLTYTPNINFNGSDSFTFTVNDGTVDSGVATVSISIAAQNDPPVANDQAVMTSEDTPVLVSLLASDAEEDPLTYAVIATPTNGTLTGTAPNLTYTPNAEFNGSDTFTFRVNDSQSDSNTATVTIAVTAQNDPPVASDDSYSIEEEGTLTIVPPGILQNDSDVDGDALTAALVTGPTHGTLNLNADGSFTYDPAPNYSGTDSFTYTANDANSSSSEATVSITVTVQTPGTDSITGMKAQWGNDKLFVLATNTEGTAGPVHVDYGSGSYDMTNVGENRWELIDRDVTEHGYLNSVRVWSDRGADVTAPVEQVAATCDVDVDGTYIEAENFTGAVSQGTAAFDLAADASVNGGYYLFSNGGVAGSAPSNEIKKYLVNFTQAGTYYVWMRGMGFSGSQDSMFFTINNDTWKAWNYSGTYNSWIWTNSLQVGTGSSISVPSAGQHTIKIAVREPDSRIDGFYITMGTETPTGGIPSAATALDPNNCSGGEISWDVISSVTAAWNPDLANELTVTAVNDWADATQVSFEYVGMTYDMAWNEAESHWKLTVDADVYYDTIRVYSEAGGDLTTSVEDQTLLPVDQLDDFTELSNGARPGFGNWTGVTGSDGTMGWAALSGSTASGSTGPSIGNPDPYVYLESSAASQTYGVGVTAGSSQYIESNTLDASAYEISFEFDWNMNVGNNTDATLHVDVWNGSSWDLDVTGNEINTGNNGDVWVPEGSLDLSEYTNADMKIRIRYIVGTGTTYRNDVAVDNLYITGTVRK